LSGAGGFRGAAEETLLLPVYLLEHGLIAPEGRPVAAPSLSRFLILAFELAIWGTCVRLLRGRSPLLAWLVRDPSDAAAGPGPGDPSPFGSVGLAPDSRR